MSDPSGFLSAFATAAATVILFLVAYSLIRLRRAWAANTACVTLLPPAVTPCPEIASTWLRFIPGITFAIIIAGAVLRLIGITHQGLWLDEAYSAYLAAHRFPQIVTFLSGSDVSPPLYYLLLHVWLILGSSVLAMRLLSVLASVTLLIPTYLLGCRVANQRVALLATTFTSLSAFQVWYGQEVRMYALLMLAIVTAMYAFVRAWQDGDRGFWAVFTCSMLAAFYLDYSAFYVYSALVTWFLLLGRRNARMRKPFALSGVAIFLGYLPWLFELLKHLFTVGRGSAWIGGANETRLLGVLTDLLFNRSNLLLSDADLTTLFEYALSLALLIIVLWLPRRASAYPLLAIWLCWPLSLGVAASLLNHPVLIASTMMVVQPALFLLLAMAAEPAWKLLRNRRSGWWRTAPVALCLGVFIITNVGAQAVSWSAARKEDWRGAATLVAAQQHPGDLALFNAYFTQMPFDYYFHQASIPPQSAIERGYQTDESLLFANLTPSRVEVQSGVTPSGYARVWLILSHTGEPDATSVPPWLPARYNMLHQWRFSGITVQLYQRR